MGFFSVNVFNRAKVFVDSDPMATAKVVEALKKAGIPYERQTKRPRSNVGVWMDVSAYARVNQHYTDNPQHYVFIYTVYVPRKRLKEAKEILHI